jgi:glutamyl-Q tRNA(Asp) synthetase
VTAIFRFAPSPNGRLQLGHAFSALLNRQMADRAGGHLLLRLEDIDPVRCTPDFETAMLADLHWLGIAFDRPPLRQSAALPAHRAALQRLEMRELLFPCFCSRGDIARRIAGRADWPRDPDGAPLYPGTCRELSAAERARRMAGGERFALRLDMRRALARAGLTSGEVVRWPVVDAALTPQPDGRGDPAGWGDVVLARKEVPTSYHLAVSVDDAAQNVSHVVRGLDLEPSTAVHRLLQHLLGLPTPRYHHHRLLLDTEGQKLSKSTGSTGLAELRAAGWTPADVREAVGMG